MAYSEEFIAAATALCEAGRFIDSKGWVPATSGNFSARLPDGNIAITTSGKHKGRLEVSDIMLIDANANPLDDKKPSAETLLHTSLYRLYPQCQAVLHPHPLNAVLMAKLHPKSVTLADYELLKAFPGINTHETKIILPVFANDQNIPHLARIVEHYLETHSNPCHAYLIAGHGMYTWGASVAEALRLLEALDYLFECELTLQGMKKS
jgi:methylthioribulose-1-phosphate dehydratase